MMIGMPPLLCRAVNHFHPMLKSELYVCECFMDFISRYFIHPTVWYGYPGIFAVAAACVAADGVYRDLLTWTQNVRDAEFLLEMRLSNLGEDPTKDPSPVGPP